MIGNDFNEQKYQGLIYYINPWKYQQNKINMDIKHSDPKLSVEEAWLTMTICIYMGAGSITPHQLIQIVF